MKITHALLVAFFMGILAQSSFANEYKAPSIKWNSSHTDSKAEVVSERNFNEFEENSYKVEEGPSTRRNLASEKVEKDGRDPSSEKQDKDKAQDWQYQE